MSLEIIRDNITNIKADAIVNTANPEVAVGRGVDAIIYDAAGREKLLAARAEIGPMDPGEIAVTPAFDLDAKYIIHTVGPVWQGGDHGEIDTVATCYARALEKGKELGCESMAFPLLAAGAYGFPKDIALKAAISEISGFLFNNEMEVYLVVYDKEAFEVSGKVFDDLKSYIDESEVKTPAPGIERHTSKGLPSVSGPVNGSETADTFHMDVDESALPESREDAYYGTLPESREISADIGASPEGAAGKPPQTDDFEPEIAGALPDDIDDVIKDREETFQQRLFRLIDRKALDDREVYKKANIDRKHFSKIKSNVNYNPSKRTAVALAIALELNLDETKDLLLRAGIALTRSSVFDIIIIYCIEHHMTDIYEINCILFHYDQPMLGA